MTKKFITLSLLTSMLAIWSLVSVAQQNPFGDAGSANPFGGPTDTGPILYDQMFSAGTGYLNSSEYTDAANLTKTSETADDFDVPAGGWTIGKAVWTGYYGWGALGGATNINVRIYADDNGMPGTELHAFVNVSPSYFEEVNTGTIATYMEYTFSPAVTLGEGKHWISFQIITDYTANGDWGWADAQNNPWLGEKLHWRNPLDGWGWGATTWTPGDLVMWFGYFDRAFALYEPAFADDMAAVSLVGPLPQSGLTATENITMKMKNEGSATQTGFDVSYSINGGTPVVENVGGLSVNPEETVNYTFATTADLSATGIYDVEITTMLSGDMYTSNDAAMGQTANYGTVYTMTDGVDITACEGTFVDPGGLNANFLPTDEATITIYPGTAGKMVRLTFLEFDISWSDFTIYDGENTSADILGYWQTDDNPGVVTALNTAGALTIHFKAPGWADAPGWIAMISCYDKPDDDFGIVEFEKSTSLIYTTLAFDFTVKLRNLGGIAQSKDVTFYVDGTAIGTVNTGVVNPTEYATVTLSYTMTYDGNIHAEVMIPVDQGDDPTNDHAEMFFDSYIIDTFVEFFEQEQFPPEGWSVPPLSSWALQTNSGFPYDNSFGCAQAWVPWGGSDTLITPQLIISNGDQLSLFLKTSNWWPGKMMLMWKDGITGALTEIETLVPTINYEQYVVDISSAAGTNYLVFVPFCDDPFAWGGELTMDDIVGISPMLWFVDEDLKASNLQGTATPAVNASSTYTVDIQNRGNNHVSYNSYQVKLMQVDPAGDIELVSTPGGTLTHLQQYTHNLNYSFQSSGVYDIYGVIDYGPDMNAMNDTTQLQTVYVQVSGTVEVEVGTHDDWNYWLPFRTGTEYSFSQSIYPGSMIGETGALTGMKYFYNNDTYGDIIDVPVMVYIAPTTLTAILGYISPDDMTLVYDDTVDFIVGYHEWYVPYDQPINYTGGSLLTYVFHHPQSSWSSVVNFAVANVSDTLSSWSTSYSYLNYAKPDSASYQNKELQIPAVSFFMNTAGFGELAGTVFDENGDPLPDADVTIDGTTVSAATNQNGEYIINEILGGAQSLTATKFEYEDETNSTVIQSGVTNYLDFNMTLKPRVDITGVVVGNDSPTNFLEGALVTLSGYSGFTASTDVDGVFNLPWVYGNETYSLTVSMHGFETYTDNNIVVTNNNIDLGTIELVELMSIPYSVFAEEEGASMITSWNEPNTSTIHAYNYDVLGTNGYANEPNEDVWLGNIYETEDRGTITAVEVYWWESYTFDGEVQLDIVDEDGNVVMSSEVFDIEGNTWQYIDIPDVFFEGTFYAMIRWEDNPETTHYLGCEDGDLGNHGPNLGYIMYPGDMPYLVSEIVDRTITFEMVIHTEIEEVTDNGGRAVEGYNVYFGKFEDILLSMTWSPINSDLVTDLTYADDAWPPVEEGEYIYAVEAVFTTGESVFSFSNTLNFVPVGVEEFGASEVKVYPNPARNMLFIENSVSGTATIYSITGQHIGNYQLNGQLNEINVDNFKKGLYLMKIVGDNDEVTTVKFLKD